MKIWSVVLQFHCGALDRVFILREYLVRKNMFYVLINALHTFIACHSDFFIFLSPIKVKKLDIEGNAVRIDDQYYDR